MVEIVRESLLPHKQSVLPTIIFRIRENLNYDTIVLSITGLAYSEDDKIIGTLLMMPKSGRNVIRVRRLYGQEDRRSFSEEYDMMLALDRQVLDHIEEVRLRNRKRDVVLKFDFFLTWFKHNMLIGAFGTTQAGSTATHVLEVMNHRPGGTMTNTDAIIATNEQELMDFSVGKHDNVQYTISASDWINDYQEAFGIGKFMIIESPKISSEIVTGSNLSDDEKQFQDRLVRAYQLLPAIELSLRKGDWDVVVMDCRSVLELFEKDVTQFIKKLVAGTTGITEDKAGDLTQSIDKLYAYTSDLHHPVDGGKVKDAYTGGREDAYLAYSLVTSVVNLLGMKFKKIISKR